MVEDELDSLRDAKVPAPSAEARIGAVHAAMAAYDAEEKISPAAQGSAGSLRLIQRASRLWREIMQRKLIATPAIAGLVALPIAGYTALLLMEERASGPGRD